jgi:hypothetical protein
MPKHPKPPPAPSTLRRHEISEIIELFGREMVQKCSTCKKHNRACLVHVRSGKCGACNRLGQRCDVRVTQSEFRRLADEKIKLKKQIQESRDTQEEAFRAHEKALEEMRVARAKEERLRQQMDLLDRKADEALAVEEREIQELEETERTGTLSLDDVPSEGLSLQLSPATWGAFEGYPLEFWEENGFGTLPIVGGSS